ncbi:unknown [Choristoneura fumiferana multiple nucleopolyhedrovirus]|uniref:Ac34 n=1 Tax=Choristoneura fumiferana nuclear polyhedrosis virus TaxID=208973 RepID=Q7TLW0_NPVCF|nr:unknown [Choristoneura fumiferana multiple nucleopolyhedrovirus]AAP29817.1 unknown [Choristoneura fumiferana multiple nucleopolyhedrovirus]
MALVKPPPPPMRFIAHQNGRLQPQLAKLVRARERRCFEHDIGELAEKLKSRKVSRGHLGDVLELMGRQSKLLPELVKNDDEFRVVQQRDLGHNTIEYLNFLQHDKLFYCRLCYTHADWLWCEFHKTHAYRGQRDIGVDTYVDHLNSDMGVVALVEEYYHLLATCNERQEAKRVLKTLTNFESLNDLLASYNYSDTDADTSVYELMDFE